MLKFAVVQQGRTCFFIPDLTIQFRRFRPTNRGNDTFYQQGARNGIDIDHQWIHQKLAQVFAHIGIRRAVRRAQVN